ncbi:MAG TPA: NAD(P)H-dependent oxidoreductase subunit E [Alphaproteobacteria bacterium]|nr:NAD(P)H-dependent oxidoreductase subunit E [Alphaproteobacteria bacterium]
MKKSDALKAPFQPESFEFQDQALVADIFSRYPKGREHSGIMPLLDLAQRQVAVTGPFGDFPTGGGWIPRAAMDKIAEMCGVAPMKVYEVATFYSMYNLEPVGRYLIQLCTTTPCWLCGSSDVVKACTDYLGIGMGQTTADGYFTLMEVECLGACSNAPMIQVNDLYYEDLTAEKVIKILSSLKKDMIPPAGPQNGRQGSMAITGPTSLEKQAKKAGVL